MYRDLHADLVRRFGEKTYKLALAGGMSCPNRDGTIGRGGCTFCSEGGSGEFAASASLPIPEQLAQAKARIGRKYKGHSYIAYFQSYTNTYAEVSYLRRIFTEAMADPEVRALSIATRPDCLGEDVLDLLAELRRKKPVWVELGLQTSNEETARRIRRGYALPCFIEAVTALHARGLEVIVHVILGLPGETREDMFRTIECVNWVHAEGIKLQLLHVLRGTPLEASYRQGEFQVLDLDTYVEILGECVERLDPSIVIHRLTGDGPKRLLVAPLWSGDKKRVRNRIQQEFTRREICQGRLFREEGMA